MFSDVLKMLVFAGLASMLVLSLGGCARSQAATRCNKPPGRTLDEWATYLASRTFTGQPLDSVREALGDAIEDEGRAATGGSAHGQEIYLKLPDLVVVYVGLDVEDRVLGEPRVFRAKRWPEHKDEHGHFATELEWWETE